MNRILKKIPMPIVGVMLSLVALGNLVQSYGENYRTILGILATIIFIIATLKFLCDFPGLKKDLSTPIGASVFPTYTMGIMLLATYLKSYNSELAYGIWIIAILLHIVLIIYFTLKYVRKFNIMEVFPSWFIVYVGIAVAAVTSKAFNQTIGQWAFGFAFLSYLILLPIIGKRVLVIKKIPEPALPTLIIFSAPGSLCLTGYINSFDTKNMILFGFLLILSQFIYVLAVIKLIQLLKLKFYPSYSGFTFPLVISAIALKSSNTFLINQGKAIRFLPMVVKVEEIIAVIMVFYVLIRYVISIAKSIQKEN
ncbi:TDT family transporter [Lachnoclostridium phytofermentans]|uniref:C4-dicarboxylate transporter/malic acid transport protein n=1 Tax=Lachnoclostridium phytofermentans (strain ATCC 700394 / DSM 18823 / ISDg) TaxID=357809 RepID=A9KPV0_LACP7|nr:TDT family transporter [Lachnoclostridium phytofermentans]ABX41849.1 C4-dicarboxylate transporter/malic acid transport protein [Lachnoclostridium phytofermentans ISDg]